MTETVDPMLTPVKVIMSPPEEDPNDGLILLITVVDA